jgi:hypothetical protein
MGVGERTRDERRSDQGEEAITGDEFVRTAGGTRLQRSTARENPSRMARGSSVSQDGGGTKGKRSTVACTATKSAGTAPDIIKDGVTPNIGPECSVNKSSKDGDYVYYEQITDSPPYMTMRVVDKRLINEMFSIAE